MKAIRAQATHERLVPRPPSLYCKPTACWARSVDGVAEAKAERAATEAKQAKATERWAARLKALQAQHAASAASGEISSVPQGSFSHKEAARARPPHATRHPISGQRPVTHWQKCGHREDPSAWLHRAQEWLDRLSASAPLSARPHCRKTHHAVAFVASAHLSPRGRLQPCSGDKSFVAIRNAPCCRSYEQLACRGRGRAAATADAVAITPPFTSSNSPSCCRTFATASGRCGEPHSIIHDGVSGAMKRDRAATTQRAPGQASEAWGRGRRRRSFRTGIYIYMRYLLLYDRTRMSYWKSSFPRTPLPDAERGTRAR